MIRTALLVTLAGAALAACTATNDPYYRSANNPPGWVDRNRDGRDDRTQGSVYNPNNPPGWVDRDRDGRDDRVEQRRATSYRGGYYDSYGNWRSY
jgi:hypothetical protein